MIDSLKKHLVKPVGGLIATCCALGLSACSDPPYSIMFLSEADNANAGAKLTVSFHKRYYDKLPLLSLQHFSSFKSFLSTDGSYGVVLYVNKMYNQRLFTATAAKHNKMLLPVVGGLAFEPLLITRPISDGQLVLWGGLNGYDLYRISQELRPLNPEIEKKRYLEETPRPLPKVKPSGDIEKDLQGRLIPQVPSAR